MIAANTQILKFCGRPFGMIRLPIVFSQTLHETTESYIKLSNDRHFANHYHIIIHKSFNYSNIQSDMDYLVFVNGTTNEI